MIAIPPIQNMEKTQITAKPTAYSEEAIGRSAFAHALYLRQVHEFFSLMPTSLIFSFVGTLLAFAMLATTGDITAGLIWFAFGFAVLLYRVTVTLTYRRAHEAERNARNWPRLILLGNVLAGLQWGCLGSVLFPAMGQEPYRELFSLLVIVSYTGGAVTQFAPVRGAHAAFTLPAVLPTVIWIFFLRDGVHWLPGLMTSFFFGAALFLGHKQHLATAERLRLDLESEAYLAELNASNGLLDQKNLELQNRSDAIKRGQQEARRRADMLSSHFRRTLLPVIDCDARFCITDLNEAAHTMLGFSLKEVYGNNLGEVLFPLDRRASIAPFLDKLFRDLKPTVIDMSVITKSSQRIPVRLYVTPIVAEDRTPLRVAVILTEAYSENDYLSNEPKHPARPMM